MIDPRAGVSAERSESAPRTVRDLWIRAQDGLRLHVREESPRASAHLPVLCLPGLTRSTRDFEGVSAILAGDPERPRRVFALDSRGRGGSDRDPEAENYNVLSEARDALDAAVALGLGRFAVIGTSRGGLLAMLMASMRPGVVGAVVLNDIGPVIEPQGLARIKSFLEALPEPRDWDGAADALRRLAGQQFTGLDREGWMRFARTTFRDQDGRPALDFDPKILDALNGLDLTEGVPALWPQFGALVHVPVLVVRGENSDVLSEDTVRAMIGRHPRLRSVTVPGAGHAPFLTEPEAVHALRRFFEGLE